MGETAIRIAGQVTCDAVVSLARGENSVVVDPATREAISAASLWANELSARIPTYGRSTGVGANRLTEVDADDSAHGLRLLRSHATDAGAPLPERAVRAMLAVRLAQLCVPGSGIRPAVLDGLERMLNANALPTVLDLGSIGTADLSALAGTALTLMGERPASAPLEPMPAWESANALPFMSSSALTIGRACLAVADLDELQRAMQVGFALSFVALDGNPSPFAAAAARAAATPALPELAGRLRELIGAPATPARIQDPYGLRAFPITAAVIQDAADRVRAQLGALINTAQENPLFVFDGAGDVVHHAGFYQAALGLVIDGLTLAISQAGPISLSRIRMMNEPDVTGRRAFLAEGPPGSSGLMMVEYVAAAAIAELRNAAQPASLGSVVLSRGTEEAASFASQAVAQLERSVEALRSLVACELVGSVRLLRQRGMGARDLPTEALRRALALTATMNPNDQDRSLREDLVDAQALLPVLAALAH